MNWKAGKLNHPIWSTERKYTKKKSIEPKSLWEYNKRLSIHITEPKTEKGKSGTTEVLKRHKRWNSSKFAKDINLQSQEVEQTLNRINLKKSTSKYSVLKLLKYKDKNPWNQRERNNILPMGRKQLEWQ